MTKPSALRVLIVDDEPLSREGVRAMLQEEADVAIVDECGDGHSALRALRRGDAEIVFLDIQMPGMNGFEVLDAMAGRQLPVVVFVTAYDTHALKAFDANALDYLVKPFREERFRKAMTRARREVHSRRLGKAGADLAEVVALLARPGQAPTASLAGDATGQADPDGDSGRWIDRIPVRSTGRVVYVRVKDLIWVGSADYYVELHTVDGKKHLIRMSMQEIEERLDPARFARSHRTAIVNLDHVAEIRSDGAERQSVLLRNGLKLPLGKARREAFERALASR